MCYFFGRSLYIEKGGKVPIGLVGSDWGGQRVEAFSSPDALKDKTCGGTQPYDDANAYNGSQSDGTGMAPRYGLSREEPWQQPGTNPGPMQLWYAMIYPLINMRFRAAAWYQGEANDGEYTSYCCRFPAMIADWRKKMGLTLPFFWVQLAPPGQYFPNDPIFPCIVWSLHRKALKPK